ncbi:MAG TPA: class I SAM-dependent methyltransferase, partial [Opitutaceae bacterium]|nr:class I SAM-dependent methyltransferase [Opitutaceae bacterium]
EWHRWQRRRQPPPVPYSSETSKCRARLAPYCTGCGVDVGCGGDPILPQALRVDLPQPYARYSDLPVQLGGDASQLRWFADGQLDFVFSSHVLEDFADTRTVLREWLRVLRPGGRLVLYCPDEQVYRAHCAATGQPYNQHHVHADFSLAFVKRALDGLGPLRILYEAALVEIYSWELVVEKTAPPPS